MDSRQTSQVTSGVLLIVLGLIFLSGQLGIGRQLNIGGLWPLVLIVMGAARFASPPPDGRGDRGLWLMMTGGILLMHTLHILPLHDSWPLFIVAFGVSKLLCAGRRGVSRAGRTDVV